MDTLEEMQVGADGLARRIAVVGLAVSQAADELQQAAERLLGAEEQARDAETRTRAADEQLAQGATKNAELLAMLQQAREQQTDADERCRRAEQRLHLAQERARLFEEQIRDLETRLEEAEKQPEVTVIVDGERSALQQAVAAEVRRPLTSILGLTLAIKHHDPKSPDGREMVKQLATNARKLDRLVTELLDVERLADGRLAPSRRRTDLSALVRRVVEETPDLANRDVHFATERVTIAVDPALTEQMVDTLLANAGRRTVPGSPVWVKVDADQEGAVIAVDDTGPEVPEGLRQALFAALQERPGAEQKQRPRGATGLSLLSKLAEVHGGRAWVEERPGGGASFRVFLPDVSEETSAPNGQGRGVAVLAPDDEEEDEAEEAVHRPTAFAFADAPDQAIAI